MCTLWMSNATNLSHIDSLDSDTQVKAILSSSCVPIYELYCSENYFVNDTGVQLRESFYDKPLSLTN
jgi:hypothetical protein